MCRTISFGQCRDALALLGLDDFAVSEAKLRAKRTAAAKVTHPDLFLDEREKQDAHDRFSRINEACDLLLDCVERGSLPRFHFAGSLGDTQWSPRFTGQTNKHTRSKPADDVKSQPAWVRDEYQQFTAWCATFEDLTVERMDKEWRRRLAARQFEEEVTRRREAEAAERLRQEILAEEALAEDEKRRQSAEFARQQKRLQKLAEAAERKRLRQNAPSSRPSSAA